MKHRDYIPREFSKRIRAERLKRLWTLEQMGAALDLSPSTLHKFEHGKGRPTPLTMAKIARALPEAFR